MTLWTSADAGEWATVWARYRDVVASVQKENLVELDEWIQTTLPVVLHERDPKPFITQSELVKLMEWKLKKGKWRPSLMKYIENLSAPAVKKASEKALTGLKNGGPLKSAIEALCELKGVGPATASVVLAAYDNNVPFMGDEALEAIAHIIGARKYTLGHYLNFATQLAEKAKWLNEQQTKSEDSGDEEGASTWSSQRVQLCLYAAAQDTNGDGQKKKSKAVSPKPKATKSKAATDPDGEDESEGTKSSRPMRKRRKA
uniref:Uncharacterized protein n=1 Tax=Globisporangium ultimum (strain ATCC 200006 / CBS 805.95 / DAOM BR144) TaxID=431595 RepID=K3WYB7_GLOUD